MDKEYDIVVLGGGPAGYPAAIRASQLGAGVCLIEEGNLGGVCLNWGCIPTKALQAAAHLIDRASAGGGTGISGVLKVDSKGLAAHKERVVSSLVSGVEKILKGRKVDVVRGRGRLVSSTEIEVEGVGRIRGKKLIIATGSSEMELPGMEPDGDRVVGSRSLLDFKSVPKSLLVIGGGVIGCEFASIFNAFGSKVTIVEMLPSLVASEDGKISRYLKAFFRRKKIDLHLGSRVESLERKKDKITAVLDNGKRVEAEKVLVAVGRVPRTEGIGLDLIGVEADHKGIKVDSSMETSAGGVYAAGDVAGGWLLAHVATREGLVACRNALGGKVGMDYSTVPTTIYTIPEISRVGLTEEEAAEKGIEHQTGIFPFSANGKARGLGEGDGFVKWVSEKETGILLGLHMIGPQATELVSTGIMALAGRMRVEDLEKVMFPHPTLSEAVGEAAEDINSRAIHLLK